MAKKDEQYRAWVAEVESSLDEAQKANFKALVESPAGEKVFGGHLREKDYYQRLNEHTADVKKLEAEKAQMYSWYETEAPKNQKLIQEREQLARELQRSRTRLIEEGLEDGTPGAPQETIRDGVRREEFEAAMKERDRKFQIFDRALPQLLGDLASIGYKSAKDNLNVDPRDVVKYSIEKGVDPNQAFEDLTREVREERAAKSKEDELKKAREEGRREALSKFPSPDNIRPSGPTIFDALRDVNATASSSQSRVAGAVKEFMENAGT